MKLHLICVVFILLCAAVQNLHAFTFQSEVQKDTDTLVEPVAETSGLHQGLLRRLKRHNSHLSICTYCCNCCRNKGCSFCCRT
nr:hepcidin [Anolis sagrei ordinatus]